MELSALQELRGATRRAVTSHALFAGLKSGRGTASQYAAYLTDVYHYARHSSIVIASAGVRLVHSHQGLAQYAFRHAAEEIGHDAWAHADLMDLGFSAQRILESRPSSACERMIALEYLYACHDNPAGLFGWMYALECLGGDVGGMVAKAVDAVLGLKGKATRFLRGHAEADAVHSTELSDVIAEGIVRAADEAAFRQMAHSSTACLLGIFDNAALSSHAQAAE